ncbi:DUF6588 family protein [Mangrovimonas spongiae]|uniref:Uncharacterized protein n=1 Tax=Mangrovimonas spongiae TaxID=2494697 RepID=A0A428K2H9_9FLAO|nr:DUF6588 family protein [Mangrovimonas spongiae]RSK40607.1 hypothetical protein EJA19_06410 [Mangrovimonas spongiae]
MKTLKTVVLFFLPLTLFAQENINDLLAAGVNDAKTFTSNYIDSASDGLAYGINNGWFNSGKSLKRFGFEISIIGTASFIKESHKTFEMHISDYENVRFSDGSSSKKVATALGHNDPDINVIITYDDPIFGEQETELTLPTGIGSANINLIPKAFVQASFSPFKGTQIKGRFFPKTDIEDAEIELYGVGLQQEFTTFLPADKLFPVAISGLIAYTHLDGEYDFTNTEIVDGDNQRLQTGVNTWLFEMIVSTKLKVINFYGGLGYITGKTNTDFLGTYIVSDGVLFSEEIQDPFSIKKDVSGVRATIGANLKLGFFGLNIDYTLAEFNSAALGLNFSF